MRICIVYSGSSDHHLNFLNNLCNVCDVCNYCTHCRPASLNFSHVIYGVFRVPDNLPPFVENPHSHLPLIPPCDVVIAFEIHPDLLLGLSELLAASDVKALIAPAEGSEWVKPGLRRQLKEILEEHSIEYAFPKPFCSLDMKESHPVVNQFISQIKIGRPRLDIELKKTTIKTARCIRSAPCGSTWYVCERLKNVSADQVTETVAAAHHSYPCNASMVSDYELKDTPLHTAGYLLREAVYEALKREGIDLDFDGKDDFEYDSLTTNKACTPQKIQKVKNVPLYHPPIL